jgi:hypothetical protein
MSQSLWIEISETMSQNKSFLLKVVHIGYLVTVSRKVSNTLGFGVIISLFIIYYSSVELGILP